ncbi:uncharacterized protein LOC111119605 [Crassostrea virginica]
MARRYNPSRFGLSRGDAMPAEPFYPNVPTAPNVPAEEYNRMLMPTCNKTGEDTGNFHRHMINKLDNLNSERVSKHKKTLWYNRRYAGFCIAFAFGVYLYTMRAMKQEEFLEKLDINVTKTDINIAKGQPIA